MDDIQRYPDAARLAQAAARYVAMRAAAAIAARGRFVVALAGGTTPRAAYALLAHDEGIDWTHIHVFLGDERCVPLDHADSNYRMLRETLLDRVAIPPENVHPVQVARPPEEAAAAYAAELAAVLGPDGRFDLVLLGMGTDGHTASLFPGTPALEEAARPVVATRVEHLGSWRVTLTLPSINAARNVLFLVSGRAKGAALARIRAGEPLPAGLVKPAKGGVTWMVDRDAVKEPVGRA